ncbi:cob(I)yrinic acid a,c-diamide adenosyltransferase [Collinsella aerofaciens]
MYTGDGKGKTKAALGRERMSRN